ncbi:hypothetical protein F4804DRAFT_128427 [Jackrogersella minutella]|nr:hypothetical protein F4804DRAFT_128427 [Jackrogersella minutella]
MGTPKMSGNPATHVLRLIRRGIQAAADSWETMRNHLNRILDNDDTIVTSQEHDELLFDDDTFSRSRRYFWAVDSLQVFIAQIDDTIRQWDNFWEAKQDMIRTFEEVWWQRINSQPKVYRASDEDLEYVREQTSRLKDFKEQFTMFQDRTHALRNGLFSASGVIESRAATRLGENVKLLTYVSIFYLPLAFVASLWSINESYGTAAFAITAALVAIGTYVIVGNLENASDVLRSSYRSVQKPIVDRMSTDKDSRWAKKGGGFQSFQPRREVVKPSEWCVALYLGLEILRHMVTLKEVLGYCSKKDIRSGKQRPRGCQREHCQFRAAIRHGRRKGERCRCGMFRRLAGGCPIATEN